MTDEPAASGLPFGIGLEPRSYERDPWGTVRPAQVFNYLQEVSSRHARSLGNGFDDMIREGLTWFLVRVRLSFEEPIPPGATLEVQTWSYGMEGALARREYRILASGRVVVAGTSRWAVIDVARRRPVRIPPWVAALYPALAAPAWDGELDRLEEPAGDLTGEPWQVRASDLDANRHVNSGRYIDWCLDTVPFEVHESHRLASLDLQYKREAAIADRLEAVVEPLAAPSAAARHPASEHRAFRHALRFAGEGAVSALAVSSWAPRAATPAMS